MSTGIRNGNHHSQRSDTTTTSGENRLDLETLDDAVEQYFSAGIVPSTKRICESSRKGYKTFCIHFGTPPTPASENLCKFVSYLALNNLSSTTIKVYLAAVCQLHISQGPPPPLTAEMTKLAQVLQGIRIDHQHHDPIAGGRDILR